MHKITCHLHSLCVIVISKAHCWLIWKWNLAKAPAILHNHLKWHMYTIHKVSLKNERSSHKILSMKRANIALRGLCFFSMPKELSLANPNRTEAWTNEKSNPITCTSSSSPGKCVPKKTQNSNSKSYNSERDKFVCGSYGERFVSMAMKTWGMGYTTHGITQPARVYLMACRKWL